MPVIRDWKAKSITQRRAASKTVVTMTKSAELCNFAQLGQVVFLVNSTKDSLK